MCRKCITINEIIKFKLKRGNKTEKKKKLSTQQILLIQYTTADAIYFAIEMLA